MTCVPTEHRGVIADLISNYNPNKKREIKFEMTIVLRDNEPIYQRPRRLSSAEKEKVNSHVNEWLAEGYSAIVGTHAFGICEVVLVKNGRNEAI